MIAVLMRARDLLAPAVHDLQRTNDTRGRKPKAAIDTCEFGETNVKAQPGKPVGQPSNQHKGGKTESREEHLLPLKWSTIDKHTRQKKKRGGK